MMIKYGYILFLALALFFTVNAKSIIPQPEQIIIKEGKFKINKTTQVYTNLQGKDLTQLSSYIHQVMGLQTSNQVYSPSTNVINLRCTGTVEEAQQAQDEATLQAYRIEITSQRVNVEARTPTGLFHALQTIRQMNKRGSIPCAIIQDSPRFAYRGLMLDCSRHFWTKDFILKQIDALAYFKINRLHLHLTDIEGWRLEIKQYPKLTEETAYRPYFSWKEWCQKGNKRYCKKDYPGAYGGYYTQEEMREIVRYASERHITVIPEIEMPGHSEEVLFAYPELSCTGKPDTHSDFCVGNEDVYTFLENILKEVMDIFPSEYIHIGGDEANRKTWETCPKCQQVMKKNNLKSTEELQGYFTHRMEKFLNRQGRKLLGWDEIMEGKLAPNATVMSWRGEQGGIIAAQAGHHVVMTPGKFCYIDKYQDAPLSQPKAQGGYVTLKKVFSYDPIPTILKGTDSEKYIHGVQANLWTEYVETPEHVEYMVYPRIFAIAEVGWSKNKTSFEHFKKRTISTTKILRKRGYNPFDVTKEIGDRKEYVQGIVHDALNKKVAYYSDYSKYYPAQGDETLTNGIRANWDFADGNWQGFIKKRGVDVMIDLEKETMIRNISADFLQSAAVQIYIPTEIEVSVSSDGKQLTKIDTVSLPSNDKKEYFIHPYHWKGKIKGRYVYFKALPRKEADWLFTDEIIINKKK